MTYRVLSPIDDYVLAVGKTVRVISNESAEQCFRIGDIGVIKSIYRGSPGAYGRWIITPQELLAEPTNCTVKIDRNWFAWHLFVWQVELL